MPLWLKRHLQQFYQVYFVDVGNFNKPWPMSDMDSMLYRTALCTYWHAQLATPAEHLELSLAMALSHCCGQLVLQHTAHLRLHDLLSLHLLSLVSCSKSSQMYAPTLAIIVLNLRLNLLQLPSWNVVCQILPTSMESKAFRRHLKRKGCAAS